MHEVTCKNSLPAMTCEEPVYAVQGFLTKPKPPPALYQPSQAQTTAELVADAVTQNGCGSDHEGEDARFEYPLLGKEAGYEHKAFARHEQAQDRLAFQRHDHKDDQIAPGTEEAYEMGQTIEHDVGLLQMRSYLLPGTLPVLGHHQAIDGQA